MRALLAFPALLASLLLAGCPIYGGGSSSDEPVCTDCYVPECSAPGDCRSGEVCGADQLCHVGQCDYWGCTPGYRCNVVAIDVFSCIPEGSGLGGSSEGGSGAGGDGSGGASASVFCGNPADCGPGETCAPGGTCEAGDCTQTGCVFGTVCDASGEVALCVPGNPAACGEDADCASLPAGTQCVSGLCTAPGDLCTDRTQCALGSVCAEGKCTASCMQGQICPSAYTCDSVGLCANPAKACSITNDCGSSNEVCVAGACVPRAVGAVCDPGFAWVENGCIPDQAILVVCAVDGQQDACASGSVCLHHNCYLSCETPNEAACNALPSFNLCKSVATSSGTHAVCGADDNLGNQCDPTLLISCQTGLVCVDGSCL